MQAKCDFLYFLGLYIFSAGFNCIYDAGLLKKNWDKV